MKLNTEAMIIGAGYAGLIAHKKLDSLCINSIIFERGYNHQYSDRDYVVVCKNEMEFAHESIEVMTRRITSGASDFSTEFTHKVYNKKIEIKTYFNEQETQVSYKIDNEKLLENARIYGNIEITNIDVQNKVAYGNVLHLNKKVEVHYDTLISTIPIHEFQKLVKMNFLREFSIFISYFPIGIKKITSDTFIEDMYIEYYSDPNIPFYRKQYYGNSIYYEYCLNKPYTEKFTKIVSPGKFVKIESTYMKLFYEYFANNDIHFCGRFATWDPDFLLDHAWDPGESVSNMYYREAFE